MKGGGGIDFTILEKGPPKLTSDDHFEMKMGTELSKTTGGKKIEKYKSTKKIFDLKEKKQELEINLKELNREYAEKIQELDREYKEKIQELEIILKELNREYTIALMEYEYY